MAPLLALLLHLFLASASGEAEAGDETCAAAPPLVGTLAAAFGCSTPCQPASLEETALGCLFSSAYPEQTTHGGAWHNKREMTYGEMLPDGFGKLLGGYGLMGVPAEREDVFVDLGSGTGKLVLQAFLSGLQHSYGIELAEDRHRVGVEVLQAAHEKLPGSQLEALEERSELSLGGASVLLTKGDLLANRLHKATSIAFSASLCFPDELLQALATKLREELSPGAFFWSLKEFPRAEHVGLSLVAKLAVHTSWSSQSRLLVYVKVPTVQVATDLLPQPAVSLLVDGARELFGGLAKALGAGSEEVIVVQGGRELPAEALQVLRAESVLPALRLLRAFGAPRSRTAGDICGCDDTMESPPGSWSLTLAELVVGLGHSLFLKNTSGSISKSNCLTLSPTCTLGDLVAFSVFELLRRAHRCKEGEPGCRYVEEEEDPVGKIAQSLHGWPCVRSSDGRTLLHSAVFRDRTDLGQHVFLAGGNTSHACVDQEGQNAVHVAVRHGARSTLAWLLKTVVDQGERGRVSLQKVDGWGRVPAGLVRNAAALLQLNEFGGLVGGAVRTPDESGKTPLAHAAQRGDLELAKALLELGAEANSPNPEMDTSPIMLAARTRHRGGPELVRLLVQHGADIHAHYGSTQTTAMHVAASHGGLETVKVLLELGAKADVAALHGVKPIDFTTDPKVVELLKAHTTTK